MKQIFLAGSAIGLVTAAVPAWAKSADEEGAAQTGGIIVSATLESTLFSKNPIALTAITPCH